MIGSAPQFTKSEFFSSEPSWRLKEQAPQKYKDQLEALMNDEGHHALWEALHPDMNDPYYLWNGEVVDRGRADGGPGSGNWGHEGRPGEVGGSAEGGGKHNRITKSNGTFTSFSKRQKKAAKPHIVKARELMNMPLGTKIIGYDASVWEKHDDDHYMNLSTGEIRTHSEIAGDAYDHGLKLSLAIPKNASTNFNKSAPHKITKEEVNSQPLGTNLIIDGKTYVQTSKHLWENPYDISDFYFNSELVNNNKEGYFEPANKNSEANKKSASHKELQELPKGSKITGISGDDVWEKFEGAYYMNNSTGEIMSAYQISQKASKEGLELKISKPEKKSTESSAPEPKSSNSSSTSSSFTDTPSGRGCKHGDECFSESRKKKAGMFEAPSEADDLLRGQAGEVWQSLDSESREALYAYTYGYNEEMNAYLRGEDDSPMSSTKKRVDLMTDAIEKSALHEDITIPRGCGRGSLSTMLNCSPDDLYYTDFLEDLVGMTMTDEGFLSCGSAKGRGMTKSCSLEIYCPAGTKAIYAEPFSEYGYGDKLNWDSVKLDGKSEQSIFSKEDETILQRGTTLRITGYERRPGEIPSLILRCEVTEQNPKRL